MDETMVEDVALSWSLPSFYRVLPFSDRSDGDGLLPHGLNGSRDCVSHTCPVSLLQEGYTYMAWNAGRKQEGTESNLC